VKMHWYEQRASW